MNCKIWSDFDLDDFNNKANYLFNISQLLKSFIFYSGKPECILQ